MLAQITYTFGSAAADREFGMQWLGLSIALAVVGLAIGRLIERKVRR
jgi:hypothetical protein